MKNQFLSLLAFINMSIANINAQSWNLFGGNTITTSEYLGNDGSSTIPLRLKTITAYPIEFHTTNTQRMTILSGGNVGIGTATPAQRFSVSGGHIQLVTPTNSYMIGDHSVLWHNDDISNIYVGVGAGEDDNGENNTFVGNDAGNANTSGTDNTFIGRDAGYVNTIGYNNTFIGSTAGSGTTTGDGNVFVGVDAGYTNTTGFWNVGIGTSAGEGGSTGGGNVYVGFNAGQNNTTGSHNSFMGYISKPGSSNLVNATAIGAYAYVTQSNSMVLGSINGVNTATANTNVGIGTTAPSASLHIDGTFRYRVNGANPTSGYVLTTDGSGNATWQPAPTGVTACTTATTNYLTKWCATPPSLQNSIVYEHPTSGYVGIGTTSPIARFEVENTSAYYAIRANTVITGGTSIANYGLLASSSSTGTSGFNVGVYGYAPSLGITGKNIGVAGMAGGSSSMNNYGGHFQTFPECTTDPYQAIANVGVYARGTGFRTGDVCNSNGFPGIAGFFQGIVVATGGVYPSDINLKDSIQNVSGEVLQVLGALQPKQYVFKHDSFPYMRLPAGKQYGLIAQQTDTILPELVQTIMQPAVFDSIGGTVLADTFRFKALNYNGLIPLLVAGVNELAKRPTAAGNYCGSAPSPITGNFEVPLNNNNYYFTGHGTNPDSNFIGSSVAIGLPCGNAIPLAKLHVLQSASNPNEDSTSAAGIFENDAAGSVTVGVFGTSYGEAEKNYGGIFHATSTHTNAAQSTCGVWGSAINGMDENRGVFGDASGGDHNFGVYGIAGLGTTNYAVFGTLEDTSAIGSGDWAGYFNGPVFSSHGYTTSDVKLKTNIKDLDNNNALALINSLQPKSYEYKNASYPSMQLPKGNQYGLIAQEVESVLPQLVKEAIHPPKRDKQGKIIHPQVEYLAVNYTGFIPVLIGAVKEQQHTIDSLKDVINDRLSSLEKRLNGCCNANNYKTDPNDANTEGSNRHTVELSNLQSIILDQNAPNPFAEQTVIGYLLPDDIKTAEIIFHDAQGKQIKQAQITHAAKAKSMCMHKI
jgi:hypothetical protein